MILEDGVLDICELKNVAQKGLKPKYKLASISGPLYFANRTIGYSRAYLALGAGKQIDLLVRVFHTPNNKLGEYVNITYSEYEGQYKIDRIETRYDDETLERVDDLTLVRMENVYEVIK